MAVHFVSLSSAFLCFYHIYHLRTEVPTPTSVIQELGFLNLPYLWFDGHIVTWCNCIDCFLVHPFWFVVHKLSYRSVLYILSCWQHYECAVIQVLYLPFLLYRQVSVFGAAVHTACCSVLRQWHIFKGSSSKCSAECFGVPKNHDQEVNGQTGQVVATWQLSHGTKSCYR